MSIAKGKVYASKEQLSELFNLPDGVEILAVRAKELEGGFEFLVVSAEETSVTEKDTPIGFMRRTGVPIKNHVHTGGFVKTVLNKERIELLSNSVDEVKKGDINISIDINAMKQGEKDVQKIFENIVQGIQRKGNKI